MARTPPRRSPATPAHLAAPDARRLAWDILQQVEAGAFADALLGHRLTRSGLAPRDQGLVTRLVYGTLAWQGYLDHLIAAFSRRPPEALDPPVRSVLRLALFQISLLTRIPPFAAVSTAVDLIRPFRGGAAASLVNAVLRRAADGWRTVPFPSRDDDPIAYLSTRLSHPRWLVERWVAQLGIDDAEALLRANNEPAPTVLRVNRRVSDPSAALARLRDAGYEARAAACAPAGIQIEHGGNPETLPGYADGALSVQGEASQLVGLLVAPQPGQRVLDACAAPGGKATHLAELMDDCGEVVALDVHARGVARIRQMARRLRLGSIAASVADATRWADPGDGFDAVLVDAPCSGLGTLRAHPEVKWRRTPADVGGLAQLQRRLLTRASQLARPGGSVVYATCTLTAEENDEVIDAFLAAQPAFVVEDPRPLLPASMRSLVGDDGVLRTFPHRHGLDGFFAVRLKRRAAHGIVGG